MANEEEAPPRRMVLSSEHDSTINGDSIADIRVEEKEEWQRIAKLSSQAVALSRLIVGMVLIVAATLVSITIYRNIRNDQFDDFARAFAAHADKIKESFHRSVERKMQAIDTLSVAFTSHSVSTSETFPRVTLPDFEVRTSGVRVLAEAPVINICMVVEDEDREEYEAYIREQAPAHYNLSVDRDTLLREFQDSEFGLESPAEVPKPDIPFREAISNLELPSGRVITAPNGTGPYLPIWQVSPAVPWPTSYFFNLFSHPATGAAYKVAIASGSVVMAAADNFQDANYGSTTDYFKLVYTHSQYRHQIGENYKGGPSTAFAYPIFDSFDPQTRKVVAIASSAIYWRLNFANVLPPDASGIICVLENSFNQTMTFRVDGGEAIYLGPGDLHDAAYDDLGVSSAVHDYVKSIASPETRAFTSVGLNIDFSKYYLTVYPSKDTEILYINNEPSFITGVVVGVFLFTSCLFLAYDYLVARRQRFVMSRALASSAIVSSLFPSQVRDKLYEQEQKISTGNPSATENAHEEAIARFMKNNGGEDASMDGGAATKPIASFFESTTILFADLAGFTQWSSSRSPEHVFVLLESLYQSFDEIALRRGVFKVETVR